MVTAAGVLDAGDPLLESAEESPTEEDATSGAPDEETGWAELEDPACDSEDPAEVAGTILDETPPEDTS